MDNSINAANNISMRGNLTVTTWNNMKPKHIHFKTTDAQDMLVRKFLKDKTKFGEESELSVINSEFIHKLFEFFTGKVFNGSKTKKTALNYGKEIYIHDNNFKLTDGVEFMLEM